MFGCGGADGVSYLLSAELYPPFLVSMLALSDDNRHYRVREENAEARIAGDVLFARWHPWKDVTVETWLKPASPWHIRIHRITTPRELHATEGGFAVARAGFPAADQRKRGQAVKFLLAQPHHGLRHALRRRAGRQERRVRQPQRGRREARIDFDDVRDLVGAAVV